MARNWLLQDVAHYAAVPCVMPPPRRPMRRCRRPSPHGLRRHCPLLISSLGPGSPPPMSGFAASVTSSRDRSWPAISATSMAPCSCGQGRRWSDLSWINSARPRAHGPTVIKCGSGPSPRPS
jgi:hypothetical protein